MTDTAVPLPETETEAEAVPDDGSMLTADQRRRVSALQIARDVLENKPALFAGAKVPEVRSVGDLTYLADWIIDGTDTDAPLSLVMSRDAANKAYFDSGWEAARREALAVDERKGGRAAVDWLRDHPADGRLIDGPDTLTADLGPYPDENNGPGNP